MANYSTNPLIYSPLYNPRTPAGPSHRSLAINSIEVTTKRVGFCVDVLSPDAGNVVPILVRELTSAGAEKELALLPHLLESRQPINYDILLSYGANGKPTNSEYRCACNDISKQCMEMLLRKIPQVQKIHAHELAIKGMVDVLIVFDTPTIKDATELALKRVLDLTSDDVKVLDKAWEGMYKGITAKRLRNQKGGYYACVPLEVHDQLKEIAIKYSSKIEVTTLVEPKLMSDNDLGKINRDNEARTVEAEYKIREEAAYCKKKEEKEHRKRHESTLTKIRKDELKKFQTMDFSTPDQYPFGFS